MANDRPGSGSMSCDMRTLSAVLRWVFTHSQPSISATSSPRRGRTRSPRAEQNDDSRAAQPWVREHHRAALSPERAPPRAAKMVPPFQGFDQKFGLLTQGGVPRLCRVTLPWAIESGPFGASEVCPGVGGLGLGIQCVKTGSETALERSCPTSPSALPWDARHNWPVCHSAATRNSKRRLIRRHKGTKWGSHSSIR